MRRLFFILLIVILLLNCIKNPVNTYKNQDFSIYFPKNDSLKIDNINVKNLSNVELKPNPWISEDDILFYDFSSHCIYLKKSKKHFFDNYKQDYRFPENWWGRPFFVVANGKRCYTGYFHSYVFNSFPNGVFIDEEIVGKFPKDIIHIANSRGGGMFHSMIWFNEKDVRNNIEVKNALIESDIFHKGLHLKLDSVHVVKKSDTSTVVQYTFTLTNKDQDNLYVLDPTLMESSIFHFFTWGVIFWNENTVPISSNMIEAISPNPYYNWESSWFIKLRSNHSIHRTITLKGYSKIPKGTYYCSLRYASPIGIKKEERILSDGRYWIGEMNADPIEISIH